MYTAISLKEKEFGEAGKIYRVGGRVEGYLYDRTVSGMAVFPYEAVRDNAFHGIPRFDTCSPDVE